MRPALFSDKAFDMRMKQYGDQPSEQKALDKRVENAHVVIGNLSRDITHRLWNERCHPEPAPAAKDLRLAIAKTQSI